MFRTQQNAFDDVVAKATDENLTSENWEYILDVCDRVGSQENGAKDAVVAMIKRLAHRNANVQLYTLELANALSQNCGRKMHQELASRSFTDALLRLANDRNTHQQVKAKILERMAEWTEMFSRDPDLGIMEGAYTKLKSQNPNLHPPSKPTKRQITDVDRQKEEDELQMALALSIKDKAPASSSQDVGASAGPSSSRLTESKTSAETAAPPSSHGTTAATVSRVRALYDFVPSEQGELQFRKGDIIAVLESVYKDWWRGSLRGQTGIFPLNYVEKLADPTQEELQREAEMEADVFGQIKTVEKLLTLLSTSSSDLNVRDNEEITELYSSTLAMRPKLIELIGKYSQKKDDFTQLNEKFIKARRDYESLLEASMSHPGQPQSYGRPGQQQQQPQQYGYGGGGYPSQGHPAQQGPGRYYTPGPESVEPNPHGPGAGGSIPQNGPQPFVYDSQSGALPSQQYPPQQQHDPRQRIGSVGEQQQPQPQQQQQQQQLLTDPYGQHRPQSTYETPQELASYSSPVDLRQNAYNNASQKFQQRPPSQPAPQQQVPSQPSYNAPQPPYPASPAVASQSQLPAANNPPAATKPYQPPQHGPPTAQQSYPPPQQQRTQQQQQQPPPQNYHPTPPSSLQPGYVGPPGSQGDTESNPADFYR